MAQLALLAQADANDRRRATVRAAASMAGDAIWIADDLADIGEDWTAGCWSRPLWILTRRTGSAPADPASAIAQLVETGVAAAETQRLASKLDRLRRIAGTAGAAFSGSLQATVRAWVDELPE
ncbi:MAG: hypothetical protein E6J91_08300 [Deltaproteobacteria bacterium]|nr:MAG: hypothetical protein E6J91_08300 [Deltaproteobacteria bacterium]